MSAHRPPDRVLSYQAALATGNRGLSPLFSLAAELGGSSGWRTIYLANNRLVTEVEIMTLSVTVVGVLGKYLHIS